MVKREISMWPTTAALGPCPGKEHPCTNGNLGVTLKRALSSTDKEWTQPEAPTDSGQTVCSGPPPRGAALTRAPAGTSRENGLEFMLMVEWLQVTQTTELRQVGCAVTELVTSQS